MERLNGGLLCRETGGKVEPWLPLCQTVVYLPRAEPTPLEAFPVSLDKDSYSPDFDDVGTQAYYHPAPVSEG